MENENAAAKAFNEAPFQQDTSGWLTKQIYLCASQAPVFPRILSHKEGEHENRCEGVGRVGFRSKLSDTEGRALVHAGIL